MNNNNEPFKLIMQAVEGILTDFIGNSVSNSARQSPLMEEYVVRRPSTPNSQFIINLEVIHEDDNNVFISNENNLDETLLKLNQVFKNLMSEICIQHLKCYEDYKSLQVMLGVFTSDLDKLFIQNLKKQDIRDDERGFKEKIDELCGLKINSYNDETYLEFLITCYLYHLLLEKVYYNYLMCTYDPVYERLFANGLSLYVLMRRNIPRDLMEKLLLTFGYPIALEFDNDFKLSQHQNPFSYIRIIDDFMLKYNLWRLFLARLRRFIINFQQLSHYFYLNFWLSYIEFVLQTFLSWFNVIYFIPRIATDILNFIYHLFFVNSFNLNEPPLSFNTKFLMLFNHRWETVFRDLLWFVNSFFSLFIFVGQQGFLGFYLNAFMQLTETLLNLVIYFTHIQYQEEFKKSTEIGSPETIDYINVKVSPELKIRWDVDNKIRNIRLKNSVGVLLSSVLILPCMAAYSFVLPLLGAVLGLVMSFIQFKSVDIFNRMRREIKDPFLVDHSANKIHHVISSSTLTMA